MRYKRFFTVLSVTYYVDIFKKKGDIKNNQNIFSTYIGNGNNQATKSLIVNNVPMFNQNITVELDYSKDDLKEDYLVRILADIENRDGTREKFLFNSTLIDNEEKVDVNENLVLYVILYIVLVCLIIMIIVVIFLKWHKKKEQKASTDLNASDMPLNDKERPSEVSNT